MVVIDDLRALNREQRAAFIASLLGWTLDAFDFFLMVLIASAIAKDFATKTSAVMLGVTLTLAFRPLGALVFGWLADRFGRRPVLMADVLLFSVIELASAFAPDLTTLLILRAVFGFAMGGEWGIGASLVMESVPAKSRGVVSGILQEGYALGYLLAAVVFYALFDRIGWRGMFAIGVAPALLLLYIRQHVKESPAWESARAGGRHRTNPIPLLLKRWKLLLYVIVLMTAFNFFSHGTQDNYPNFLKLQHHYSTGLVSILTIVLNLGAISGGLIFGALSERIGRRRAIAIAALLALPSIWFWAYGSTPLLLGVGAFLIQIAVQGAWGVVPVHLNELAPEGTRGLFPGFAYQFGNLIASGNAVWQARIAEAHGDNWSAALAVVAGVVAVVLALLTWFGPEAKGVAFGASGAESPPSPVGANASA